MAWLREIPDHRVQKRCVYSLEQVVFCGLMLFVLRHRSLRAFVYETQNQKAVVKNFGRWIRFSEVPSDDGIRYALSTLSTKTLNDLLKKFHHQIERRKILSTQSRLRGLELCALDGTGQISSASLSCEKCLTRDQSSGERLHMHGQLLVSITNLQASYSLPFQFEPIQRSDTETRYSKNDCELEAAKRLIQKMKTQFPKRRFCFLGDNLFAVEPMVKIILERGWHFIFTAKPERNSELFFMFDYAHERKQFYHYQDRSGHVHEFSWTNGLPVKQAKFKEQVQQVNLLCYQETDETGALVYKSAWMTNLLIEASDVVNLAWAGRSRFSIENINFNAQKNLGFHTEHNFGHFGNLPNVFFGLAQIAQLLTQLFRSWVPAREWIRSVGSERRYFERLAVLVTSTVLEDEGFPILYLKFKFDSS